MAKVWVIFDYGVAVHVTANEQLGKDMAIAVPERFSYQEFELGPSEAEQTPVNDVSMDWIMGGH